MIELYIIRHGLAGERGTYENDDERPLTEEGRDRTRKVAKRLHALELQFDLVLTSPLVRAKQTADILQSVNLCSQVEISPNLAPEGQFKDWLVWLDRWRLSGGKSLAIVGHEPDLSQWAEQLLWGTIKDRLILKKAGIIGLLLPSSGSPVEQSQLFWLCPPRFLL